MNSLKVDSTVVDSFMRNVRSAVQVDLQIDLDSVFDDSYVSSLLPNLYTFSTNNSICLLYKTIDNKPFILLLDNTLSVISVMSNIYDINTTAVLSLLDQPIVSVLTSLIKGSVCFRRYLSLISNEL